MIKYHLYGYGPVDEVFYALSDEEAVKIVKARNWRLHPPSVGYGWYMLFREKL